MLIHTKPCKDASEQTKARLKLGFVAINRGLGCMLQRRYRKATIRVFLREPVVFPLPPQPTRWVLSSSCTKHPPLLRYQLVRPSASCSPACRPIRSQRLRCRRCIPVRPVQFFLLRQFQTQPEEEQRPLNYVVRNVKAIHRAQDEATHGQGPQLESWPVPLLA